MPSGYGRSAGGTEWCVLHPGGHPSPTSPPDALPGSTCSSQTCSPSPSQPWVRTPGGQRVVQAVLCRVRVSGRGAATRGGGPVRIPDGAGPGPRWFTVFFLFSEVCVRQHCLGSGGTVGDSRSFLSLNAPRGLSHVVPAAARKAHSWGGPGPWNVPHRAGHGDPQTTPVRCASSEAMA